MAGLDGRAFGAMAAVLAAAACSGPSNGTDGNGGAKNQGGSSSVGTVMGPTSSSIATGDVGAGGFGGLGGAGGAGGMGGCNPPAAAGSFWAQTAQELGVATPVSMCQYRGDVLLVVNTASV